MNEDAVNEYTQQSKSIIEASPQMDEENTKVKLIQPFIQLLGWDIYSPEVELEHPIQMGSNYKKVDYGLLVGDEPVMLIEAKPLRSSISGDDANQLRSYMRQVLKVDWGIITNGKSFEVLNKNASDSTKGEVSLVQFDLRDLDENPNVINVLSKESIKSGKSDEIAKQVAQATVAIEQLGGKKAQTAQRISEVIQDELDHPILIDIEDQAVDFIDMLMDTLEEQKTVIRSDITGEDDTTGLYRVHVIGDKEHQSTLTAETQSDVMAKYATHLIYEYSLFSEIEPLPYVPGRRKTAIINTQPSHPNGLGSMKAFKKLDEGCYLFTHMGRNSKKREIERLADICDVTVQYSGDW